MALVLATSGLYGVISYLVAQRTREVGIRVALGAGTGDMGIGVGAAGALGLSRLVESLLYGVSAQDPFTFAALAGLLGCVALVATWLPARRAGRVDPVAAIKSE
jgi:putative ABC transport system permease protein